MEPLKEVRKLCRPRPLANYIGNVEIELATARFDQEPWSLVSTQYSPTVMKILGNEILVVLAGNFCKLLAAVAKGCHAPTFCREAFVNSHKTLKFAKLSHTRISCYKVHLLKKDTVRITRHIKWYFSAQLDVLWLCTWHVMFHLIPQGWHCSDWLGRHGKLELLKGFDECYRRSVFCRVLFCCSEIQLGFEPGSSELWSDGMQEVVLNQPHWAATLQCSTVSTGPIELTVV